MKEQLLQFGDMPDGTHFEDGHGRKFIKLKLTFAGEDPFEVYRVTLGENDEPTIMPGHEINAVDYQGYGRYCPSHVEFKVIPMP